MTQQQGPFHHGTADAGAQIARLRRVLALVEEIAGAEPPGAADAALDEAALVSAAYESALPIVQRRFDTVAAQTAAWAAAGASALATLGERQRPTQAAAERLAGELRKALGTLRQIVSA
jgi:hypothetical protein